MIKQNKTSVPISRISVRPITNTNRQMLFAKKGHTKPADTLCGQRTQHSNLEVKHDVFFGSLGSCNGLRPSCMAWFFFRQGPIANQPELISCLLASGVYMLARPVYIPRGGLCWGSHVGQYDLVECIAVWKYNASL